MKFLRSCALIIIFLGYSNKIFSMNNRLLGDSGPAVKKCSRAISVLQIVLPLIVLSGCITGGFFLWKKVNELIDKVNELLDKMRSVDAFLQGCPNTIGQYGSLEIAWILSCRSENNCSVFKN